MHVFPTTSPVLWRPVNPLTLSGLSWLSPNKEGMRPAICSPAAGARPAGWAVDTISTTPWHWWWGLSKVCVQWMNWCFKSYMWVLGWSRMATYGCSDAQCCCFCLKKKKKSQNTSAFHFIHKTTVFHFQEQQQRGRSANCFHNLKLPF